MVWIQPRMIEHGVAKKEKENNLWTAECVNERFRLESLTVKPTTNISSNEASAATAAATSKKKTRATAKKKKKKTHKTATRRFVDDNLAWGEGEGEDKMDEVALDDSEGEGGEESGTTNDGKETKEEKQVETKLWRIVMMRTDVNSEAAVVAEDDAEEVIRADWRWIEANMLAKLSQIISEEGTDKVDKFLLLQFQMLYINQANEIALRQIELRRSVNAPTSPPQTKKKESADTDEVLSTLNCSLWVKLRYRAGTMRVCHTKIDFSGNTVKVLIFLTDILAVTKEKSTLMARQDSLRIKAREGDYFFSDIEKRDDVYELISQLWNMDMEKRLHKVTLGRGSSEVPLPATPRGESAGSSGVAAQPAIDNGGLSSTDSVSDMSASGAGADTSSGSSAAGPGAADADDSSSPMLQSVGEFLTHSGSLVVGDFVISKTHDEVGHKPQITADRVADVDGPVLSRSDGADAAAGGGSVAGPARRSQSGGREVFAGVDMMNSPTRERASSSGGNTPTARSSWAVPDPATDPGAWSPSTRAIMEEAQMNWSSAAVPTRGRVRSGSVSIETLPPRRPSVTTPTTSPVLPRAAAGEPRKPSMKDVLETKKRNEHFRFLFQLPADESLLHKFDASLSFRKVFVLGRIYLSAHYACFHSLLPADKAELRLAGGLTGSGSVALGVGGVGADASTALNGSGGGSRARGLRDGGVLADSVLRGRRGSSSFGSGGSGSSGAGAGGAAPFLKVVVPFVEIAQIGLEDDGPGSYLIALNTKRNQFVFSVVNADVFARIQELKNEACAHLMFVPVPRSPGIDPRHQRATTASPLGRSKEEDVSPVDWNDPEQLKEFFGEFKADEILNEEAKEHKWTAYFRENGMGVDMLKTLELKKLVYEGVPNGLRARLWQICSGSIYRLRSHDSSGLYRSLFEKFKGRQSLATEQIEKDLHRSFDHPFYQPGGLRINALRRVLTAYSWHNPEIGYCQSMNMIAAAFLLYLNEEETFCLLITLVEDMLKGYYTKEMLGSCVDQRVFEVMLTEHMPRVHAHVTDALGIPIAWFSCPWFLCLFIGKLPLKCVCRILDWFFLDGPCVLFQIGLALFKISENEVLNTKDEGSTILAAMQQRTLEDPDLLFKVALRDFGSITMDKVKQLRNSYKLQVIIDLEDEKRREAEWEEQQKAKETLERMAKENEKFTAMATAASVSPSASPPIGRQRSSTVTHAGPPSFIAAMAGAWSPIAAAATAAAATASTTDLSTSTLQTTPSTVPVPKRSSTGLFAAGGGSSGSGSSSGGVSRRRSSFFGPTRSRGDEALPSPRSLPLTSSPPPTPSPISSPLSSSPPSSLSSSSSSLSGAPMSSSLPSPASPLASASASAQVDSSPAVLTRRRSNTTVDMAGPPSLSFLESLGAGNGADSTAASPFASSSPPPESPYRAPLTLQQPTTATSTPDPSPPGAAGGDAASGQRGRVLGRRGTPSSPLALSSLSAGGAAAATMATATAAAAGGSPSSSPSHGRRATKLRLADMRSMKERGQFSEFSSWGINVLENLLGSNASPPASPTSASSSSSSSSPPSSAASAAVTNDGENSPRGAELVGDLKAKLASASSFISSLVAPTSP